MILMGSLMLGMLFALALAITATVSSISAQKWAQVRKNYWNVFAEHEELVLHCAELVALGDLLRKYSNEELPIKKLEWAEELLQLVDRDRVLVGTSYKSGETKFLVMDFDKNYGKNLPRGYDWNFYKESRISKKKEDDFPRIVERTLY